MSDTDARGVEHECGGGHATPRDPTRSADLMHAALPYIAMVAATVVAAFAITQLAMLATTIYLHRYLAHGGITLRPEVRAVSRIVIWVTTALKPRQWARVHRFHHATEDTPA